MTMDSGAEQPTKFEFPTDCRRGVVCFKHPLFVSAGPSGLSDLFRSRPRRIGHSRTRPAGHAVTINQAKPHPWEARATVFAYSFAPSVENQSFSVLQSLYNDSLLSQSNTLTTR